MGSLSNMDIALNDEVQLCFPNKVAASYNMEGREVTFYKDNPPTYHTKLNLASNSFLFLCLLINDIDLFRIVISTEFYASFIFERILVLGD